MKRNIKLIFAACATMMAAACTKQVQNETVQSPEFMAKEPMSITCVSNGTKTQLAEDGKAVNWTEGDQLKIFTTGTTYEGVKSEKFDLNIVEGKLTQATFEGEVAEGTTAFVALYPYSENATFDGTVLTTEIPTTQSATAGNFAEGAALAWAKGTKTIGDPKVSGVQMQNICALMAFTLPENITFAKKVTITANAENAHVAGAVQVNVGTDEISYVGGNRVELSGDFVGGKTYYTTIAPGTYVGGFTFVITTAEGNTYTRQNTSTVVAGNGSIAKLGTLSLVLSDSDINCNVVISHNVESGILTGSTATASVSVATEEFQSIVKINSVQMTLKQGETAFRTLSAEDAVDAQAMEVAAGKPYLPKGDYSYETVVNYTVGTIARSVTVSGTATSPQVSGITFGADVTGYTNYDTYTASGAAAANKQDGSTIYGIGANYASGRGLSAEVYEQCSNLLSVASTLDGEVKSGEVASQSWKAHTIGANITFDGFTAAAGNTKIVHVTGLPHIAQSKNDFNVWSQTNTSWNNSGYLKIHDGAQLSNSRATLSLYTPSDIDVTIHSKYAAGFATVATNFEIYVSNVRILEFKGKGGIGNNKGNDGESDNNGTLTASAPTIYCNNTYNAGASHCRLYNIAIRYR